MKFYLLFHALFLYLINQVIFSIKISNQLKKNQQNLAQNDSSSNNSKTIIHIIPHSHIDPGWIDTTDDLYNGFTVKTNENMKKLDKGEIHFKEKVRFKGVRQFLDEITSYLLEDRYRTFVWPEQIYFARWWDEQNDFKKFQVRDLVDQGQLELLADGWVQQDEVVTSYDDIINNYMRGFEWLLENFNIRPKVAWQIDSFGHPGTLPRLLADMGVEFLFVGRTGKDKEKKLKHYQFNWKMTQNNLGEKKQLFTQIMFGHYNFPGFFLKDPTTDRPSFREVTQKIDTIIKQCEEYISEIKSYYKGNNFVIPFGDDWAFDDYQEYPRIDYFIKQFNQRTKSNIELRYSTLTKYLFHLKEQKIEWPVRENDFVPLHYPGNLYWNGFFSSRPNSKRQITQGSQVIHSSLKLYSLRAISFYDQQWDVKNIIQMKNNLLENFSLQLHHDAITGTSVQHVANDFKQILYNTLEFNKLELLKDIRFYSRLQGVHSKNWVQCLQENTTYQDCPTYKLKNRVLESRAKKNFLLSIQNPSDQIVLYSKIKVPPGKYQVMKIKKINKEKVQIKEVEVSLLCSKIVTGNQAEQEVNSCDLHIKSILAPNSISLFEVIKHKNGKGVVKESNLKDLDDKELKFVNYTHENGLLFEWQNKSQGQKLQFYTNLRYYDSCNKSCRGDPQKSGHYLLLFKKDTNKSQEYSKLDNFRHYDGGFLQQWEFNFKTEENQRVVQLFVRKYQNMSQINVEVQLKDIPTETECIVYFQTPNISSNSIFYHDQNGLEMIKRIYKRNVSEYYGERETCVEANYYPVTSALTIVDEEKNLQMTVMNDRPQGGSSGVFEDGSIELMQNRRPNSNDNFGVGQVFNEMDDLNQHGVHVNAEYQLLFFNRGEEKPFQRKLQNQRDSQLQYFFTFHYEILNEIDNLQVEESLQNNITVSLFPNLDQYLNMNGSDVLSLKMFPVEKNKILIRLTNTADDFDKLGQNDQIEFNIQDYCKSLWNITNPDQSQFSQYLDIQITEKSISNNFEIQRVQDKSVTIANQEIKLFEIYYKLEKIIERM